SGRVDLADTGIVNISNKEVPEFVHRQADRNIQLCSCSWAAIAAEALCAVARHGSDGAGRIHLADTIITRIADEEVAGTIHRQPRGIIQLRTDGRPAIPAEALCAIARHGGDDSGRVHLADAFVTLIEDKEVAEIIRRDPLGGIQLRVNSRTAVAAKAL